MNYWRFDTGPMVFCQSSQPKIGAEISKYNSHNNANRLKIPITELTHLNNELSAIIFRSLFYFERERVAAVRRRPPDRLMMSDSDIRYLEFISIMAKNWRLSENFFFSSENIKFCVSIGNYYYWIVLSRERITLPIWSNSDLRHIESYNLNLAEFQESDEGKATQFNSISYLSYFPTNLKFISSFAFLSSILIL
jgi:hypothetical protein